MAKTKSIYAKIYISDAGSAPQFDYWMITVKDDHFHIKMDLVNLHPEVLKKFETHPGHYEMIFFAVSQAEFDKLRPEAERLKRHLNAAGMQPKNPRLKRKKGISRSLLRNIAPRVLKMAELCERGKNDAEIADEIGNISREGVKQALYRLSVELNARGRKNLMKELRNRKKIE